MRAFALATIVACHVPAVPTSSTDADASGALMWTLVDASSVSSWSAGQSGDLMLVPDNAHPFARWDSDNVQFEDVFDGGFVIIASRSDGGPWLCGACESSQRVKLRAWLASRPYLQNGGPIVRTPEAVDAIVAAVANELEDYRWAATLDVMAADETGYRSDICGGCPGIPNGTACTREQGAESCGAWATERGRTPRGSTMAEQARIALTMLKESESWCPAHPLAMYAGVGHRTADGVWHPECRAIALTDFRLRQIGRELGRTP